MLNLWVTEEVQSLLVPKASSNSFQSNGYGSKSSYCETTTMCESTVITRYSRGIVTAGSICEVTVITSYGSTQDDEHLCGETMNRACDSGLQVLEKHNYICDATYN